MLTRWTISNFKSIREPVTIDLAPLTIFSGINSAGKSTLIQSILMVAQSFMTAVEAEAIVLGGPLINLGNPVDILHDGYDHQTMEIGFEFSDKQTDLFNVRVHSRLSTRPANRSFAKQKDRISLAVESANVSFHRRGESKVYSLQVKALPDTKLMEDLSRLDRVIQRSIESGVYNYKLLTPEEYPFVQNTKLERVERVGLKHFIPWRLLISIDAELKQTVEDVEWLITQLMQFRPRFELPDNVRKDARWLKDIIQQSPENDVKLDEPLSVQVSEVLRDFKGNRDTYLYKQLKNPNKLTRGDFLELLHTQKLSTRDAEDFGRRLASALSSYLNTYSDFTRRRSRRLDFETRLFPSEYMGAFEQIERLMKYQIYYLGPLRDDPRVIYAVPPLSERRHIGLKGEFTAAILDRYGNENVLYPLPPDVNFTGKFTYHTGTLVKAVMTWLQRMGLVDEIDTHEIAKVGYQLIVGDKSLSKKLDMTSVGVGVSQILPTIVLALLAPPDSTLIFEQPELHLHPKVQSVMADFFLGIAMMGKQCLVETHSEHLINRLRRRIVESDHEPIVPQLRIYFVEKERSVSQFREVKPNELGAIPEWPKGFFDEAENEANIILKKQIEKRRRARDAQRQEKGGA